MSQYLILRCMNMMTFEQEVPVAYFEYTTMTLDQRLRFHLYHTQMENPTEEIHKAIKYIGTRYFKWEVLDETDDEDEAKELVKYYISEYKSDVIGYNVPIQESFAGKNNPFYGEHRTHEELYGKEKAERIGAKISKALTGHKSISEHTKERLKFWNPMDKPESRAKASKSKMGAKNPKSKHDYVFGKPDGTEFRVECLAEFCRENPGFTEVGVQWSLKRNKKYKGMSVYKVPKKV